MLQSGRKAAGDHRITIDNARASHFSKQKHTLIEVPNFLSDPSDVIAHAKLQNFARITPQYPGRRASLDPTICDAWREALSPLLSREFNAPSGLWSMQGWYSIVDRKPQELLPIQCLPHVDGTDPNQIAMMLYLHRTAHGGTAFFRHKSTGLEALTDDTFPQYRQSLEQEVRGAGLPPKAYVTDGEPYFQRTFATEGRYNQAVFYRGNILHSGVIDNETPLPANPDEGRLTINAFLRPPSAE